jgi:hypothetical protein
MLSKDSHDVDLKQKMKSFVICLQSKLTYGLKLYFLCDLYAKTYQKRLFCYPRLLISTQSFFWRMLEILDLVPSYQAYFEIV